MVDDIDDLRIAYRQAMNTLEQATVEIEQHLRTVERQMGSISQMAHMLYDKDKQIERLRDAGDAMADDVPHGYESLRHWQEARRG